MKKIIFLSISILIGILVYKENDEIVIPSDAIRVRIIANSNSIEDLYAKKKLKNEIKNDLYNIVKDVNSSIEANKKIEDNLLEIDKIVSSKTSDYKINYGMNYFPKKNYKGVIYPSGEYRSLVITLGKGLGENWWCVLYPPLCMMEDNPDTTDVEYRSFVLNMLKIDNN
jgi:stage II sporulation protein R